MECLVGDIVITCHEVDSKIKKCTNVKQEWLDSVYPKAGLYATGQGMRGLGAWRQRSTYPDPQDPSGTRFRSHDKIRSMWREVRMGNPGTITAEDLAIRVNTSCKYRNGVAHARRTRGSVAIRNDRRHTTYKVATLVEYLGYIRETQSYVEQLYSHMNRIPAE